MFFLLLLLVSTICNVSQICAKSYHQSQISYPLVQSITNPQEITDLASRSKGWQIQLDVGIQVEQLCFWLSPSLDNIYQEEHPMALYDAENNLLAKVVIPAGPCQDVQEQFCCKSLLEPISIQWGTYNLMVSVGTKDPSMVQCDTAKLSGNATWYQDEFTWTGPNATVEAPCCTDTPLGLEYGLLTTSMIFSYLDGNALKSHHFDVIVNTDNPVVNFYTQTLGASFTPRVGSGVSFLNGELVLTGGFSSSSTNEVYSSSNYGKTWTQVTTTGAMFTPRTYHAQTTFVHPSSGTSAVFIMSGANTASTSGWVTLDKVSWSGFFGPSGAVPVNGAQLIQYGQYLVWIGGVTNTGVQMDRLWSATVTFSGSTVTVVWNPFIPTPWGGRSFFGVSTNSAGNRLIVCGGMTGTFTSAKDCYISNSGPSNQALQSWTALPTPPWSPRGFVSMVKARSYLYLLFGAANNAGTMIERNYNNEIWISPDDANSWLFVGNTSVGPRAAINSGNVLVDGNAVIIVVGGQKTTPGNEYCNDVYLGFF